MVVFFAFIQRFLWFIPAFMPLFSRDYKVLAITLVAVCVTSMALGNFITGSWLAWMTDLIPNDKAGNYWGAYDLGLRDAYLVLAASELGFDTLIMGIRDAEALKAALSIPEEEEVMAVIAVGKRAKEPGSRPRKELSEVAKFF